MHIPNSSVARDIAHVLHPTTNLAHHKEHGATIMTHGRGIYVYDESGREYIESMAGLWCAGLGFSNESLVEAATAQMRKLPFYHGFTGKAVLPTIGLAERLKAAAPFDASKVFFTNSGSEANDTQIKLLWYYNNAIGRPQKKKIIAQEKGYHGVTIGAGSLTAMPAFRRGFDQPLDGILHVACPHHYRYAEAGESEEEFSSRLADALKTLILQEGSETIAAFIAEPVMGAGGVIVPPAGYFQKVQAVLWQYDIHFIADEVICGFGRTGSMFGCETLGITPDSMTVAKQLSSGYLPIAAVLIKEDLYDALVEQSRSLGIFGHGITYGGHPVPAAVALRTLELYEELNLLEHVRFLTPHFQARLRRFSEHPLVGEARGVGLIGALELVADKSTKRSFKPDQGVGAHCVARCQAHGLIGRASGDSLLFCPPLIIDASELDEMFDRFQKALDDTEAWVMRNSLQCE